MSGWGFYFGRTVLAAAVMGAVLWWIGLQFDWAAMQAVWGRRLLLAALVIGAAAVTYFAVMAVFGWRAQELRSAVAERRKK